MGYLEDYEDYITPDPVDYEVYQSMIEQKDAEIEKLQHQNSDYEDEIYNLKQDLKRCLKKLKNEVKKHENITKNI